MIPEKDNPDQVTYLWKGAQRLPLKGKKLEDNKISLSTPSGCRPTNIVQMLPPAAVTALAYHTKWYLVAIGTAHGLALYDYKTKTTTIQKCTLNTNGKSDDITSEFGELEPHINVNESPVRRFFKSERAADIEDEVVQEIASRVFQTHSEG